MNYCLTYDRDNENKYIAKVKEVRAKYREEDTTVPEFLELYKDKTICFTIDEEQDVDLTRLQSLYNKYKNFKLEVITASIEYLKKIAQLNIPFFLSQNIDNWDTLNGLIKLGVSDICITNKLCFNLNEVHLKLKPLHINIRVIPNVAQSGWQDSNDITKFFIRPEDLEEYSEYIDIIDFAGTPYQQEIFYEIYAIDKKWAGPLNKLIFNFSLDLDNRKIYHNFAKRRITCGKKCAINSTCNICNAYLDLAETLEEHNLVVKNEDE